MKKIWLENYPFDILPEIKEQNVPLHSFLDVSAETYPEHTAVIFFGKKITYAELHKLVNKFAFSLYTLGVKKGDRVALFLPNCLQSIIAYYATLKIGGVVVQVNPMYVERELIHQINDAGVKVLIYLDLLSDRVNHILPQTSLEKLIRTSIREFLEFPYSVLFDIKEIFSRRERVEKDDIIQFGDLLMKEGGVLPNIEINPKEDIALLQYTGGTTGVSKGVMLTHFNLVSNVLQARQWFSRVEEGREVFLSVLPFFHVFGMTVCMNFPIFIGATIVAVPKFKVQNILNLIHRHEPTVFPAVPTIFVAINNFSNVHRYHLSSIKFCLSGAAPLSIDVMRKFEELTGGKLVEGYGLTEASPITHCNPLFGDKKEGSIGFPLPGTECKIVDMKKGKKEVAVGEIGELMIKGPQVMKGYWNNEEETAQVLKDGWLKTGDIAKVDEEGFFYIVDRKKDMIISGGFNIFPKDVEDVLLEHPKIDEVVVAGVDDDYSGEIVKAFVLLKKGYMASESEIIEYCKRNMAKYKVPKSVEFRHELPKNMLGKVLRRKLK